MSMPYDVVFVRHGQSELNMVNNAARAGDDSLRTPEFRNRHDSDMRLTQTGVDQAIRTGQWIMGNIGKFDRYYVSPYRRTKETAANLGLNPKTGWMVNNMVRERSWGEYSNLTDEEREAHFPLTKQNRDLNPWYWAPPGGESLDSVSLRLDRVLDTLHREMAEKRVIIVTHGEYMWVARFVLERMQIAGWLEADKDSKQKIQNTMVLHYTRRSPENPEIIADNMMWARAICPWDEKRSINNGNWWEIERSLYSDDQLLEQVNKLPRLLPGQ